MKLAAIDIGSNAIRMQVSNAFEYQDKLFFKKLEYIRFPLRLGQDVFATGTISDENKERFVKLMQAYKILVDLYQVDGMMACATSAMRESENGQMLVDEVEKLFDLNIQIIDGDREAELINIAINNYLDEKTYIHIDVGGGSTELNIFRNREKVASKSFRMGSVRRISKQDTPQVWNEITDWIKSNARKDLGQITAIGTGGNINKIFELSHRKVGKPMPIKQIEDILDYLNGLSLEEKLYQLQLNPDRADVIVPATEIYLFVMKACRARNIVVPDVGLKDGIMSYLYKSLKEK